MSDLRKAAQQALEALETPIHEQSFMQKQNAITALRAALAQEQAEPVQEPVATVAENATTEQQVSETPPSDYRRGYWDGFAVGKREGRIEAEDAAEQAEPVQEPVACPDGKPCKHGAWCTETYCQERCEFRAPPQHPPLTDEEIEACRQQGYSHAGLGATFDFNKAARAIERKVRGEE